MYPHSYPRQRAGDRLLHRGSSEFVTYIALTTWYTLKELKRAPEGAQIPESASTTDGS